MSNDNQTGVGFMASSVVLAFIVIAALLVGAAGFIGLMVYGMVRPARDTRAVDDGMHGSA